MTFKKFWNRYRLFIIYNIFGFSATILEAFFYWLFYRKVAIGNVPATLIAWIITVLYAFITNKLYVYRSTDFKPSHIAKEFASFFGFRAVTGIYNILHMWITVDLMDLWPVTMKVIAALIVGFMNYFAGKSIIFKRGMLKAQKEAEKAEIDKESQAN